MTNIVPANTIDYSKVDEVCGYQMLLCKIFERAGGFKLPPVSNKETITIRYEGKTWLKKIENVIDSIFSGESSLTLCDIPKLIESYDFFYRVCTGTPNFDYVRRIRFKVADRYAKGDKSISLAQVALMLNKEISRDIRNIDNRYLNFAGIVKTDWIRDLEMFGKLDKMPLNEAYEVLRYLLYENLTVYLSNPNEKAKWVKTYTLSDEELDSLDSKTLWSYIDFDQAAAYVMGKSLNEQDTHYTHLLKKLSTRPDTHPFLKECIAIEEQKYFEAL